MANDFNNLLPTAIKNLKRIREAYKNEPQLIALYEPPVLSLMSSILSYSPYKGEVVILNAWKCNGNIYTDESELVDTEDYNEYESYSGYIYSLGATESELASLLLKDFYESHDNLRTDLTKYHFNHHVTDLT